MHLVDVSLGVRNRNILETDTANTFTKLPNSFNMSTESKNLFSVTIFGYRKPGMDEDFYHKYVSETHAQHLKDLLLKNKIVSYHIVLKTLARSMFSTMLII